MSQRKNFILQDFKGGSITDYATLYFNALSSELMNIDLRQMLAFIDIIKNAIEREANIFVFGNGGSAAIANHFQCDFLKAVSQISGRKVRLISLSSSPELITAFGNDICFDEIFSGQLAILGKSGDVCIAISSSGNSLDVIRGLETAKELGMTTLGLAGFNGGTLVEIADYAIHVNKHNYGIVEDSHHALMHIIAQYLALK